MGNSNDHGKSAAEATETPKPGGLGASSTATRGLLPGTGDGFTSGVSADFESDDHLQELRWSSAFRDWDAGEPAQLGAMLRDVSLVVPDHIRQMLADLIGGIAVRTPGRRGMRSPQAERELVVEYFQERARLTAQGGRLKKKRLHESAVKEVEKRHGIPGAVRGIVEKVARSGYTFEAWTQIQTRESV